MYTLGIDTSNYTTSLALIDRDGKVIQQKKLLPIKKGEIGLRQSDAVFHHTQQLAPLFEEILSSVKPSAIEAVGVSVTPRPVDGSYMPCFTVGHNSARIIARSLGVPLFEYSHQEGHIAAAILSCGHCELFSEPFIAFHVSGGTTEAVLAAPNGFRFKAEKIASTLDLNAGQAIDRTGVMLGLSFPCGMELEKLALCFAGEVNPRPTMKGENCCLSGLQNICQKMYENNSSKEEIAIYCLKYIEKALEKMAEKLLEKYGEHPLLFAGGVMSNSIIRGSLEKRFNAYFAEPEFSRDNAAGVAFLAQREFLKDESS